MVPKGAEHCPTADEEAHMAPPIEPQGTANTGNAETAAPRRFYLALRNARAIWRQP